MNERYFYSKKNIMRLLKYEDYFYEYMIILLF